MENSMDLNAEAAQAAPLCGADDVAEYLGVPVKTLYKWHLEHHWPPHARIGTYLRYVPYDVVAWAEGRKPPGA
jgi:predicted DNA-binding transcriptional regulator AlpA